MSCISEILKIKGDKEFLSVFEKMVIEDGGVYKGYEYLITFVDMMAHRCGYVAIPCDNKLHSKDFLDLENDTGLSVHGGITFNDYGTHIIEKLIDTKPLCNDKWIGFDAMHFGDCPDIECYKKYFGVIPNEIMRIEEASKTLNAAVCTIKNKEYMIEQCKNLIDQIIEINK